MSPKGWSVNPHKDKRGLGPQEAKFVDAVPHVGPQEAAKIAYPAATEESQKVIASQKMADPKIVSNISKLADNLGLNRKSCVEKIKEGLEATKLFGKEAIEHADHASRLKAAEMGLKLHGELKDNASQGVVMSKEAFVEMCRTFWVEKPA